MNSKGDDIIMKNTNRKNKKSILKYLKYIKNLELHTSAGKVNVSFGIILTFFILCLTTHDWILKLISLFTSFLKTLVLHENIVDEYETTNTLILIMIWIFYFFICIFTLYIFDHSKVKIDAKIAKALASNIDKQKENSDIDEPTSNQFE